MPDGANSAYFPTYRKMPGNKISLFLHNKKHTHSFKFIVTRNRTKFTEVNNKSITINARCVNW